VDARQFPRSSGYPEDAATGIAAAALAFGLLHDGLVDPARPVTVRQGRAMGRPSRIELRFRSAGGGVWMGGEVRLTRRSTAARAARGAGPTPACRPSRPRPPS